MAVYQLSGESMAISDGSVTPRKSPAQKRAKEKVQLILQVTAELLNVSVLEGFSTNKIARAAGINVATLYQYFPNKQSIIYALYQQWLDEIAAGYDAVEAQCYLQVDWETFFTRLHQSRAQVSLGPLAEINLDRMMSTSEALSELDRTHAEQVSQRMVRYLKGYGSNWSKQRLMKLSLLIYELSWAANYRIAEQSGRDVKQTREWSTIAHLSLIAHCLEK